jgi:hypothetical protein
LRLRAAAVVEARVGARVARSVARPRHARREMPRPCGARAQECKRARACWRVWVCTGRRCFRLLCDVGLLRVVRLVLQRVATQRAGLQRSERCNLL